MAGWPEAATGRYPGKCDNPAQQLLRGANPTTYGGDGSRFEELTGCMTLPSAYMTVSSP